MRILHEIIRPPAIKAIKEMTFAQCLQLGSVILCKGREEIGDQAFCECTSLRSIVIPCAIKKIHDDAFKDCSNLTKVFCDEIEEFVTADSIQAWWNRSFHKRAMTAYSFLVRCSIPQRLGSVQDSIWRDTIHEMLRRIPAVSPKPKKIP